MKYSVLENRDMILPNGMIINEEIFMMSGMTWDIKLYSMGMGMCIITFTSMGGGVRSDISIHDWDIICRWDIMFNEEVL